ncbi:MAG: chemotaxis protein CheW [Methylococcaceae bacterium]
MTDKYTITKADAEKEQLIQLVGFKIGKETFGVDILMVQEIIRSAPITHVPNSPEFVEGVINLRGSIIPVIDLRKRLDLHTANYAKEKDWILILDIMGRITGFIVDLVTEVIKVQEDSIEPPPEIIVAGLHSQYIRGVCEIDKELLILLDFNRILLIDELKKLKSINMNESSNNANS